MHSLFISKHTEYFLMQPLWEPVIFFVEISSVTTFLLCFFFPPLHSRHNFCPRSVYQPPFSLSQMALCPWNVTQSCDVTRDPPVIYSVECPERPASSFCGDDRSIECQPVYQNINVRFRHTVMTSQQYVAVACVAVPVIRKKWPSKHFNLINHFLTD